MRPFLRTADRAPLAPVGWVSEPAGDWAGKDADIVYDPHRHQVLLVRNDIGNRNRAAIAEIGYRRVTGDGDQEMWLRERVAQTQARFDRLERRPSHERATEIGMHRP